MESRAKLFGHPIHQMLIVFPLGLFVTSAVFDAIYLLSGQGNWAAISYWMITAGLIGGAVAAVFGLVDWIAIPSGTRAKFIGAWHGLTNVAVMVLFLLSRFLRQDDPLNAATFPVLLSFAAVALGGVSAWLGGELVSRLGVGVDNGAHLNSPNSLSGRPANEEAPGGNVTSHTRPA
jgi:uncharacterized membrane protein